MPTKKVVQVGRPYVVLRVLLREETFAGCRYKLQELEDIINELCAKGYRLHTMSCNNDDRAGVGLTNISATLIFERFDLR